MRLLTGPEIEQLISPARLVAALREGFAAGHVCPQRQMLSLPGGTAPGWCLLMPAFSRRGGAAVKLVTVLPDNAQRGRPTVQGVVVLFSPDGTPVAVLDGTVLTRLRTAAASALASTFLSRPDSSHLVIIGTGALAPYMAAAHAAVRPIRRVSVCGRSAANAAAGAAVIRARLGAALQVNGSTSPREVVAEADIVSCVTTSATPVLEGSWLRAGVFVDLVGSFTPDTREADDAVVRDARIFADTFEGVLAEAGDILDPLSRGVIRRGQLEAELADLATGRHAGRATAEERTVFKSVGTAIEDLVTAELALTALAESGL
jgi:ornithine cyclodeaminase